MHFKCYKLERERNSGETEIKLEKNTVFFCVCSLSKMFYKTFLELVEKERYIQDIYDFLVKNLDLDSNLYNLKKLIKKAS